VRTIGGRRVEIDRRKQVLAIEIPEREGGGAQQALAPRLLSSGGLVSASALSAKAKQFDDGLYAAVELAAQSGAGDFSGKASLLGSLGGRLRDTDPSAAIATLLAAARLGEVQLDLTPRTQEAVERRIAEFRADELRSKPIGFYTWSPQLSSIFKQDRLLQQKLVDATGVETIARLIHGDVKLRATYEGYLDLVYRLTNPRSSIVDADLGEDLRDGLSALDGGAFHMPAAGASFFPPSRSHETDLAKQLFGSTPIPEGFSLVDEMVRRIRAGTLKLAPRPDSGWYDQQTYALEPLVIPEQMPEAAHVTLGERYRGYLLDLFRALLALTRETHIKQLETPVVGAARPFPGPKKTIITIRPELSAEPLAAYYLRRALSYAFVRTVIEKTFGAAALGKMRRLTASGPVPVSLDEELRSMEAVFLGAHAAVSNELGMASTRGDAAAFRRWATGIDDDPDLGQDIRAMVPLFYDLARSKTKVLAVLGWSSRQMRVEFANPPDVTVLDLGGGNPADFEFELASVTRELAYPVAVEVYVDRILDRDEFRRLCDAQRTQAKILRALQ